MGNGCPEPRCAKIKERWPAQINEEFQRCTGVPQESVFMSQLDKYTPKLLDLFSAKGAATGENINWSYWNWYRIQVHLWWGRETWLWDASSNTWERVGKSWSLTTMEKQRAVSIKTWKCAICRYMSAVFQMWWASSLRASLCLLVLETTPGLWTCSIHHNSAKHFRCFKDILWDLTHCVQSLPPDSWHKNFWVS